MCSATSKILTALILLTLHDNSHIKTVMPLCTLVPIKLLYPTELWSNTMHYGGQLVVLFRKDK